MYINCARVEFQAAAPVGRHLRSHYKRQDSMSNLPDLSVCDINNGCTTTAQESVDFPDPGSNVIYGSDLSEYPPLNGTGYAGNGS